VGGGCFFPLNLTSCCLSQNPEFSWPACSTAKGGKINLFCRGLSGVWEISAASSGLGGHELAQSTARRITFASTVLPQKKLFMLTSTALLARCSLPEGPSAPSDTFPK